MTRQPDPETLDELRDAVAEIRHRHQGTVALGTGGRENTVCTWCGLPGDSYPCAALLVADALAARVRGLEAGR